MSALVTHLPPTLHIPPADLAEWGSLPDECRADIRARYAACRELILHRSARGTRERIMRLAAGLPGNKGASLTPKALENLRSRLAASARTGEPDWRVLWNTAKWPRRDSRAIAIPAAFEAHWHKRVLTELATYHRGSRHCVGGIKSAHKKLIAEWRRALADRTHPFPGYRAEDGGTPAPDPITGIPTGWSYNNLRHYAPDETARLAAIKGTGAARALLPHVRSTRAEVLAGQRYEFDDFEPDLEVICDGQKVKPLQLACYDFASGCFMDAVWKPAFKRPDGATDKWKAAHMALFLGAMFTRLPYDSATGTRLVDEGGTARVDTTTAELLREATRGALSLEGATWHMEDGRDRLVKVSRSSRERSGQLHPYAGGDRGNPNRKRMEATHRLLATQLGSLPGYTGNNYLARPEWRAGMDKETDAALALAASLPPERASMVQHALLTFDTFLEKVREAIRDMNNRDDHTLEGWDRFTLDAVSDGAGGWLALADITADTAALVASASAAIQAGEDARRWIARRRLSPWQAWQRETAAGFASGRLATMPVSYAAEICALAGRAEPALNVCRPRTIRGAYIAVMDTATARLAEPMVYEARVTTTDGTTRPLGNGEDVECVFNPFFTDLLFLRTPRGGFLGVARRAVAVNPNDIEAVRAAQAEARSLRDERLAPTRALFEPEHAAVRARREHNARVADTTKPLTDTERILAAARDRVREALAAAAPDESEDFS